MTLPAHSEAFGRGLPSNADKAAANQLRKILAARMANGSKLTVPDPPVPGRTSEITLTPVLANLLMDLLRATARGDAVTLVPVSQMLTTQQAADILNVSRPYLVGLIDKGALPARRVGNQRRLPLADVIAYKVDNQAKRRTALDEMSALHQEMGLE